MRQRYAAAQRTWASARKAPDGTRDASGDVVQPTAPVRLRLVPAGGRTERAQHGAGWRLRASVALGVLLFVAAFAAELTAGRRAVRAIPDDQRSSMYSRSLADLKQSCADEGWSAPRDHCRELASFLSQFDECRGECQTLVHQQLAPTR